MGLVPVFLASSEAEASIIRSMLENAGVDAEISSDDAGGALPMLAFSEGIEVMVNDSDEAEAKSILEEYRRGDTALDEDGLTEAEVGPE